MMRTGITYEFGVQKNKINKNILIFIDFFFHKDKAYLK